MSAAWGTAGVTAVTGIVLVTATMADKERRSCTNHDIFTKERQRGTRQNRKRAKFCAQNREDTVVYLEHHWLKLDLMFHSRLKAVEESKG